MCTCCCSLQLNIDGVCLPVSELRIVSPMNAQLDHDVIVSLHETSSETNDWQDGDTVHARELVAAIYENAFSDVIGPCAKALADADELVLTLRKRMDMDRKLYSRYTGWRRDGDLEVDDSVYAQFAAVLLERYAATGDLRYLNTALKCLSCHPHPDLLRVSRSHLEELAC